MPQGNPQGYGPEAQGQQRPVDPRIIQELVRRQQQSGQASFVEVISQMAAMGIPVNLKLGK